MNIQIHIAEMLFGFRLNTSSLVGYAWQFQPKQKFRKNINDLIMNIAYIDICRVKIKQYSWNFSQIVLEKKAPNLLIASNTLFGL